MLCRGLLLIVLLACVGCRKPEESSAPPTRGHEADAIGAGGSRVANRVHREKSLAQLRQVFLAYQLCIASNGRPPRDLDELKANLEGDRVLKSPRDGQPYEIAFDVDPAKLADSTAEVLIAWESTSDSEGNRCALTAAGVGLYLSEVEFQKKTKGKGQ